MCFDRILSFFIFFHDDQCIRSVLQAGQVTTASSIAWMVKYLDENQEMQEKLRVSENGKFDSIFVKSLDALSIRSYKSI